MIYAYVALALALWTWLFFGLGRKKREVEFDRLEQKNFELKRALNAVEAISVTDKLLKQTIDAGLRIWKEESGNKIIYHAGRNFTCDGLDDQTRVSSMRFIPPNATSAGDVVCRRRC